MIYYPSVIQWGVIYSEDKQFQTALMFFLAGLVIKNTWKTPTAAAIAIGAVGSLGISSRRLACFWFRRHSTTSDHDRAGTSSLPSQLLR